MKTTTAPISYMPNPEIRPLIWDGKPINFYQITNEGVLYRNGVRCPTWIINGRNYAKISWTGGKAVSTQRIDFMVAYTFLKKPEDAIRLIHINGINTDDRVINLTWYRLSDVQKQYEPYVIFDDDGTLKEVWRPCRTEYNPDLKYEVSCLGNIRDKDHNLIQLRDSYGYKVFYYMDPCSGYKTRSKSVHRAVAEAFIPNPNNYPLVNHLDGRKSNNIVFNLEWADNEMNVEHAYMIGLNQKTYFSRNQVIATCELLSKGVPHVEIERITGVDRKTISDIYRGRRWSSISAKYLMPMKRWPPEVKKQIENCIVDGKKCKEICASLDIPYDQASISLYERLRRELKSEGKLS